MSCQILYENANHSVVLLDIPTSIKEGQNSVFPLISCPALPQPFASNEPKGVKREIAMAAIPQVDHLHHRSIQATIDSALREVRVNVTRQRGIWCHARNVYGRAEEIHAFSKPSRSFTGNSHGTDQKSAEQIPVILSSTEGRNHLPSLWTKDLQAVVVYNPRGLTSFAAIDDVGGFMIPPLSVFIQATLRAGRAAFVDATHILLQPSKNSSFDLILLDPPWANRSVRRSGSYATAEDQIGDPFLEAVHIVEDHLSSNGIVAIWITNKSVVRKMVLEKMLVLNLELFEEWIWTKTASNGEPITPLDGVWRRPYEMLLLFRKGHILDEPARRRVIVAVPDLHSRKPCLKELMERLLPLPAGYNALELFARSLTAGWWSWGDEVLKFQHENCWKQDL
jgi:N6-adenosine-specific RNA methylase IME4